MIEGLASRGDLIEGLASRGDLLPATQMNMSKSSVN